MTKKELKQESNKFKQLFHDNQKSIARHLSIKWVLFSFLFSAILLISFIALSFVEKFKWTETYNYVFATTETVLLIITFLLSHLFYSNKSHLFKNDTEAIIKIYYWCTASGIKAETGLEKEQFSKNIKKFKKGTITKFIILNLLATTIKGTLYGLSIYLLKIYNDIDFIKLLCFSTYALASIMISIIMLRINNLTLIKEEVKKDLNEKISWKTTNHNVEILINGDDIKESLEANATSLKSLQKVTLATKYFLSNFIFIWVGPISVATIFIWITLRFKVFYELDVFLSGLFIAFVLLVPTILRKETYRSESLTNEQFITQLMKKQKFKRLIIDTRRSKISDEELDYIKEFCNKVAFKSKNKIEYLINNKEYVPPLKEESLAKKTKLILKILAIISIAFLIGIISFFTIKQLLTSTEAIKKLQEVIQRVIKAMLFFNGLAISYLWIYSTHSLVQKQ